jgi:hypothetical protein
MMATQNFRVMISKSGGELCALQSEIWNKNNFGELLLKTEKLSVHEGFPLAAKTMGATVQDLLQKVSVKFLENILKITMLL